MLSRQHWACFSSSHKSFHQGTWSDLEGEMMQIRSFSAGEPADLLQLIEAGMTKPQVIQADRQAQLA